MSDYINNFMSRFWFLGAMVILQVFVYIIIMAACETYQFYSRDRGDICTNEDESAEIERQIVKDIRRTKSLCENGRIMISIEEKLPDIGEKTRCRVNYWQHRSIYHTEEIKAEFLGMNDITGNPMWDIETCDEAYAEVTHWEPIGK